VEDEDVSAGDEAGVECWEEVFVLRESDGDADPGGVETASFVVFGGC